MQKLAFAQGAVGQRSGNTIQALDFFAGMDDHITGHAKPGKRTIGSLGALVRRQIGFADDNQQVEVAVRPRCSPRVGTEQDDPLRMQGLHQALAGFFDGGCGIHGVARIAIRHARDKLCIACEGGIGRYPDRRIVSSDFHACETMIPNGLRDDAALLQKSALARQAIRSMKCKAARRKIKDVGGI